MDIPKDQNEFSRKELYQLVWSKPISKILKDIPLTNHAFKKICSKHDIPLPKNGHWQKLKFNKEVEITPLPPLNSTETIITFPTDVEGKSKMNKLSELDLLIWEIRNDNKLPLQVPKKLTKPEKITLATKNYHKQLKTSKHPYKVQEPKGGLLSMSVSNNLISRALRFWDTFIKLLIKRGHKVEVTRNHKYANYNGTKFVIHGESFDLYIREKERRIMEDEGSGWKRAKYYPTGKLVLKLDDYPKREWQDSKTKPIEDKLAHIIAFLEISAKQRIKRREESRLWHEEYERKRKVEEELKKRRTEELEKFKSIINQASRWQKAESLRKYIAVVESNAINSNNLTEELKNQLQWIKDKIDWYDPMIEKEDELFEDIDRNSI